MKGKVCIVGSGIPGKTLAMAQAKAKEQGKELVVINDKSELPKMSELCINCTSTNSKYPN